MKTFWNVRSVARYAVAPALALLLIKTASADIIGTGARVAEVNPTPVATAQPMLTVGAGTIPAGTRVRFTLTEPLASDRTITGQNFSFILLDPIVVDGRVFATTGAEGKGTVVLSGHNGTSGHEGDLTLQLDSVAASGNQIVTFADQQIRINGRNRRVAAGLLGFVPYAGFGATLIRGQEIHLDTTTPINTVLLHPASLTDALPVRTVSSPA